VWVAKPGPGKGGIAIESQSRTRTDRVNYATKRVDIKENKQMSHSNGYAHPDALVSTEWVAQHFTHPKVRLIESNEDVLLYDTGHIPGAVKVDWHKDLNDGLVQRQVSSDGLG
jgi:hypothetical protein